MKNILKDAWWDFLLKLSTHKKNIPGDEMEIFVEKKIDCSLTIFSYCL